jgi:AraC-like DNA-binding protein
MAASAFNYTIARFSTSASPAQAGGKAMDELRERGLLASRFASCDDVVPQVDLATRIMPGLRILTANYAGVRHENLPDRSQGGDDLCLCMILAGKSLASQRGREMVLADGDAVLMTAEDAWNFTSPASVDVAGLRLPRSAFAALVQDLDDAVMRRIPGDAAGLRLLRKYLEVIVDDDALAMPAPQRIITSHFYDLAALAVRPRDRRLAENGSVRAARLAAIKADIVANLHDGNLTAGMVATRNRVTARYLHKLFENEAVTYSEFVLGQRLARAYAMLRNPLYAHRGIGTIAFELGFNDLSYFNRTFRWRYHATPSDVRNGMGRY